VFPLGVVCHAESPGRLKRNFSSRLITIRLTALTYARMKRPRSKLRQYKETAEKERVAQRELSAGLTCAALLVLGYSLEDSHKPFGFNRSDAAIFMVRCGSKNHDLFVAESLHGVDGGGAACGNEAG
jgi:hypothetical protein